MKSPTLTLLAISFLILPGFKAHCAEGAKDDPNLRYSMYNEYLDAHVSKWRKNIKDKESLGFAEELRREGNSFYMKKILRCLSKI